MRGRTGGVNCVVTDAGGRLSAEGAAGRATDGQEERRVRCSGEAAGALRDGQAETEPVPRFRPLGVSARPSRSLGSSRIALLALDCRAIDWRYPLARSSLLPSSLADALPQSGEARVPLLELPSRLETLTAPSLAADKGSQWSTPAIRPRATS